MWSFHCGLQFIFTVLTGGTDRGLSSGEGGTHGPFGAYYTACCSGGWAVSAGITGYLPRRASGTVMTNGAEVAMETIRGGGTGATTRTYIPVGANREKINFVSQRLPHAVIREAESLSVEKYFLQTSERFISTFIQACTVWWLKAKF